jgi:hypothetical protein
MFSDIFTSGRPGLRLSAGCGCVQRWVLTSDLTKNAGRSSGQHFQGGMYRPAVHLAWNCNCEPGMRIDMYEGVIKVFYYKTGSFLIRGFKSFSADFWIKIKEMVTAFGLSCYINAHFCRKCLKLPRKTAQPDLIRVLFQDDCNVPVQTGNGFF